MSGLDAAPCVPVSWGELLDKLSILDIKSARLSDPAARANVEKERRLLAGIAAPALRQDGVAPLLGRLRAVNEALWEIEDSIREKEAAGDFGESFVRLARLVYKRNDERAALKRELNRVLRSELVEEKSYAGGPFMLAGRGS